MKAKKLFVGLHLHKCAGTTLQVHLEGNRPFRFKSTNPFVNYHSGLVSIDELGFSTIKHTVAYWGHDVHETMLSNVEAPVFLFTFLRDPVARAISWYAYETRERALKQPFVEFAEQRRDTMCGMLIGAFPSLSGSVSEPPHQRALQVLNHFGFIGAQAHFADHANMLLDFMGISRLGDKRENISSPVEKSRLEEYRDWIAGINAEDMALWAELAPRLDIAPIMDPERTVQFFDPSAELRFDDQHLKRLRLELTDLDHFGLLPERRRQDARVIVRRLGSLLLQSEDPAEREALAQLLDQFATLSGIQVATTRPLVDETL